MVLYLLPLFTLRLANISEQLQLVVATVDQKAVAGQRDLLQLFVKADLVQQRKDVGAKGHQCAQGFNACGSLVDVIGDPGLVEQDPEKETGKACAGDHDLWWGAGGVAEDWVFHFHNAECIGWLG